MYKAKVFSLAAALALPLVACQGVIRRNLNMNIQIAQIVNLESFDMDYRHIGTFYDTSDPKYAICQSYNRECNRNYCIMATQVYDAFGENATDILLTDYASLLPPADPCPGDTSMTAEEREVLSDEAVFEAAFVNRHIRLSGDVLFQLSLDPLAPASRFFIAGTGPFRATIGNWTMAHGHFEIVNDNAFDIVSVRDAGYMDFVVRLHITPIMRPKDSAPLLREAVSNILGDLLNIPELKTQPHEEEASGLDIEEKYPRLLYRVYIDFNAKDNAIMQIARRGHVMGTDRGEPIGCMFFHGTTGVNIIDLSNLESVRSYQGIISRDDSKRLGSPNWLLSDEELATLCPTKAPVGRTTSERL